MIKANHKKWAKWIFDIYVERLLKTNFNKFYLVNDFPQLKDDKAILITPNHFSWWDGFFIYYALSKFSKKVFHIMMLEEQLTRYWFFSKLGAYSINHNNLLSQRQTIRYSRELLKDSNNSLIIYPHGMIKQFGSAELKEGIKTILSDSNCCYVLPSAFNIIYSDTKNPSVYCSFGEPLLSTDLISDYETYKKAFLENVDKVARKSLNKPDLFQWK